MSNKDRDNKQMHNQPANVPVEKSQSVQSEIERLTADLLEEKARRQRAEELLSKPFSSSAIKQQEEIEKQWPVCVVAQGKEYVIEMQDALINVHTATHRILDGVHEGRMRAYRIPKGALCSKKLFPNWKKISGLIEFRSDPRGKVVIVPDFSARA